MATSGPYRTRQDLVTEALANLGVLSAGQATDTEDYNYVDEKLDAIVRKLAVLDIVRVPDINNIRAEFFVDLADIVAGECATKFGQTPQDRDALEKKGLGNPPGSGSAAMSLKQMTRGRYTGETLPVEYF